MEKYKQLVDIVLALESDFEKFYIKKDKAAGTRVRKAMKLVRLTARSIRRDVRKQKLEM